MNLNLLVSIIIYALMAFFVGCGFYYIVNLSKYQKDFALIGKRIKTDAQAVIDLQEYLDGTTSEQNKSFRCMESNTRQCQSNNISGTSEICAVRKSKSCY